MRSQFGKDCPVRFFTPDWLSRAKLLVGLWVPCDSFSPEMKCRCNEKSQEKDHVSKMLISGSFEILLLSFFFYHLSYSQYYNGLTDKVRLWNKVYKKNLTIIKTSNDIYLSKQLGLIPFINIFTNLTYINTYNISLAISLKMYLYNTKFSQSIYKNKW